MFLIIFSLIISLLFIFLFIYASISLIRRLDKATRESNKAYVSLWSCYDGLKDYEEKEK